MPLSDILTGTTALGGAATGGLYLAFSTIVMPGLRRRPGAEAGGAMQEINRQAVRPPFMTLFFGTATSAVATIIVSASGGTGAGTTGGDEAATGGASGGLGVIVGAGLVLAGTLVTIIANVPRNEQLARAGRGDATAAWRRFERPWTRANHLRAALSLGGAALLLLARG